MSNTKPSNPNAFPVAGFAKINDGKQEMHLAQSGMTLRDWFAGQLLAARYANPSASTNGPDDEARRAYMLADALLKAREET